MLERNKKSRIFFKVSHYNSLLLPNMGNVSLNTLLSFPFPLFTNLLELFIRSSGTSASIPRTQHRGIFLSEEDNEFLPRMDAICFTKVSSTLPWKEPCQCHCV